MPIRPYVTFVIKQKNSEIQFLCNVYKIYMYIDISTLRSMFFDFFCYYINEQSTTCQKTLFPKKLKISKMQGTVKTVRTHDSMQKQKTRSTSSSSFTLMCVRRNITSLIMVFFFTKNSCVGTTLSKLYLFFDADPPT